MKTIDCTPTWEAVVKIYIVMLEDSGTSEESRKIARSEIVKAGQLADKYVQIIKH